MEIISQKKIIYGDKIIKVTKFKYLTCYTAQSQLSFGKLHVMPLNLFLDNSLIVYIFYVIFALRFNFHMNFQILNLKFMCKHK